MSSSQKTVAEILSEVGLEDFVGTFISEGILTTFDLTLLSTSDMKDLGLNTGQRNRLKNAIGKPSPTAPGSPNSVVIDDGVTHKEREQYNEIFDAIDTDGSGDIDFDEFVSALKKMDLYESHMKTRLLFDQADEDRGGTLDREEFLNLMHGAKNGTKASELAKMADTGQDVLSKLQQSFSLSIEMSDIVEAPITESILSDIQLLKKTHTWVCDASKCDEKNCNFLFNLLVLDLDLIKALMGHICIGMLETLEEKLQELGITGLIKNVNVEAVILDGLRGFVTTIHRFSHTSEIRKETMTSSDLSYLHSFRKSAIVDAADDSVQEVRDKAAEFASQALGHDNGSDLHTRVAKKAAGEVASDVGGELLAIAAASAGCSIM